MTKLIPLEKIPDKLQTKLVTAKVLRYFRYIRHDILIASEVGVYSSDVLAVNKNDFVTEIEVKVSFSDFKNEFKKSYKFYKSHCKKHEVYANLESKWIPNYYYFAVPTNLVSKVISYLESINSKYGVIEVTNGYINTVYKSTQCFIRKPSKRLHSKPCHELLKKSVIARASSDLVQRRTEICNLLYEEYRENLERARNQRIKRWWHKLRKSNSLSKRGKVLSQKRQ